MGRTPFLFPFPTPGPFSTIDGTWRHGEPTPIRLNLAGNAQTQNRELDLPTQLCHYLTMPMRGETKKQFSLCPGGISEALETSAVSLKHFL